MKKNDMIKGIAPILKINNRHKNLSFYRETLGFKVLNEENAFVDLGDQKSRTVKLILEESPSIKTRKVNGSKKLAQLIFKVTNPDEIETLLAKGLPFEKLYRGQSGWAFSLSSPEGDQVLLHSEADVACLEGVDQLERFEYKLPDFEGLTEYYLDKVLVRTNHFEASQAFYQQLLEEACPLEFIQAEGEDLAVEASETWDLAGFDLKVAAEFSLADLQSEFQDEASFLDKKERLLVLHDPNLLEVSLRR